MRAPSDWLGVRMLQPDADGCWFALSQKFLIFGKTGWIGGLLGEILTAQGADWEFAQCRMEDRSAIIAELERVRSPPLAARLLRWRTCATLPAVVHQRVVELDRTVTIALRCSHSLLC